MREASVKELKLPRRRVDNTATTKKGEESLHGLRIFCSTRSFRRSPGQSDFPLKSQPAIAETISSTPEERGDEMAATKKPAKKPAKKKKK
jgi:hypothetical protein